MQAQVTVLLCNYNYGKYILDAIESVLEQTYEKIGLVIIDDASTDNSWELIKNKYFSEDQRYEYRQNEDFESLITKHEKGVVIYAMRLKQNGGPSRARNFGILESLEGTDYYAILDADDIMYPDKIKMMVESVENINDVGVVYADYDIWNVSNDTVITEYKEPFDKQRLMQECIVHSGALIKKEALVETRDAFGFYDEEMRTCEDYDLWVRISERYVIFHIPEVLTLVRDQPNNSTLTVSNDIWQKNWQRIGLKLHARQQQ